MPWKFAILLGCPQIVCLPFGAFMSKFWPVFVGSAAFFPFIRAVLLLECSLIRAYLFHPRRPYHIETSALICSANQWTCFYMITASVMKELHWITYIYVYLFIFGSCDLAMFFCLTSAAITLEKILRDLNINNVKYFDIYFTFWHNFLSSQAKRN